MNGFEQWIWVPEKLYPDCQKSAFSDMSEKKMDPYGVAEFKKDYVFDEAVQELRLKVCGDASFQLYLNGACVMTGPATVGGDFLGNDDQPGQYYAYQAVLPVMRRQGRGRIVMLSSINGLLGIPFQSAYTAAKHALEGYAECLAMETRPHGVSVCLVEPGDHRSGSSAYRPHAQGMGDASPYADAFRSAVTVIGHDEENGADPDALGRCVARPLRRRRMPLRKVVASADQHLAVWLKRLFPPEMLQTVLRAYYLGRKS